MAGREPFYRTMSSGVPMRSLALAAALCLPLTAQAQDLKACLALDSLADAAQLVADCSSLPNHPGLSGDERADLLIELGVAHRNLDDLATSAALLTKALELRPDHARTLRMLGWTQREAHALDAAEASFTRAIALDPDWQGHLSRCVVRQDRHDYRTAVEDCEIALALHPNEDAYFFTAAAHNALLQADRALMVADAGLASPHASARIAVQALRACETLGETDRASGILIDARIAWPDDPDLQWMAENLP